MMADDNAAGTSIENLQAREFWKEEHERKKNSNSKSENNREKKRNSKKKRPKSAVQNYQRTLSSSSTRRRQKPQTARVPDPDTDSDDEGPATFVNSRKVRKDWRYYRRQGALWTDPDVHVPESRQHLLGKRPDLEAKHEKYVQSVIKKEKMAEKRVQDHRIGMRYATQTLMAERQEENILAEETALNWGRHRQQPEESLLAEGVQPSFTRPTTASRTKSGILKKDWKYYRRQGALWTDLVHLPAERLHFVLRPKIIKMDREATLRIKAKYEKEIDMQYKDREHKMRRAKKIRKQFLEATKRRKEEIKNQWGREPPFSLGGSNDSNHQKVVPTKNQRIAELALPKNANSTRPSTSVGQSYYGLLSSDTTVGPLLHEHCGRQGYDIHESGRYNVTDSITSNDEVRVNVSRSTAGSNRRAGSGMDSRISQRPGSRAHTSRPRPRSRTSGGYRATRPSTAPNAGFPGSQTGGYQGSRADPYSPSRSRKGVLMENGSTGSVDPVDGDSRFVIEMTPSSHSVVTHPATEAMNAIQDIEKFDAERQKEEAKKGSRHENWFSKPHVRGESRGKRPATPGLVRPTNYFSEMKIGDIQGH
jgi:hypothetical protein